MHHQLKCCCEKRCNLLLLKKTSAAMCITVEKLITPTKASNNEKIKLTQSTVYSLANFYSTWRKTHLRRIWYIFDISDVDDTARWPYAESFCKDREMIYLGEGRKHPACPDVGHLGSSFTRKLPNMQIYCSIDNINKETIPSQWPWFSAALPLLFL